LPILNGLGIQGTVWELAQRHVLDFGALIKKISMKLTPTQANLTS